MMKTDSVRRCIFKGQREITQTDMNIVPSTGAEGIGSPWLLMSPRDLITEE